jgi:metallo-beta-lactamase family protein
LTATDAAAATRARAAELRRRLATFQPDEPAPAWLPAALLEHIATLPGARRAWRRGVGRPAQRAQLIRAGAGGRRDYAAGGETARNLATLLRREPALWDVALQAAFAHHHDRRRALPDADLLALADDPARFLADHPGCPADYVVAVAYALGAGESELAELAAEAGRRAPAAAPEAEDDTRDDQERVRRLERAAALLERELESRDKQLAAAEEEAGGLRARLAALDDAERRAAAAEERLTAAAAQADADARRIASLQGQAAAAGRLRAELAGARARVAEHERRQAEAGRPAPTAEALFAELGPAIGRAAGLAAARIAAGEPLDGDRHLLRLAALFSELSARLGAPSDAPPPAPAAAAPAPRVHRARAPTAAFRVTALGGAEEIGGSAFLVETRGGRSVLLDAGQRVRGEYGDDAAQPFHLRVPADHLDAILVSHAHIDHVGSLPTILAAVDAEVPVWMTEPTRRLAGIMLEDSARIQHAREERLDARALAASDHAPDSMRAAYGRRDAEAAVARAQIAPRAAKLRLGDSGLLVRFLPVPHVLGSCAVHLTDEESGATLLYSGDLGPVSDPQATLPPWGFDELEPADVVIMESTYGAADAVHAEGRRALHGRERSVQRLIDCAQRTVGRDGFLLLPSFGLGRAQELVTVIDANRGRELPDAPLYVAGLGRRVMDVYDDYTGDGRGGWAAVGSFPAVRDPAEWLTAGGTFGDAVAEIVHGEAPGYVVAAPAMVSGGWSRAFLDELLGDPCSGVVFTGHVPRHGGGIAGLGRLRTGDRIDLGGGARRIECAWERISLSAHAPTRDLHAFAERMTRGREHTDFSIVHGDRAAQRELAGWIREHLDDRGATAHSLQRQVPWSP